MNKSEITLLYVDDEKDLLTITKLFLQKSGEFIVDIASSPKQALDMLKFYQYDAIISDYEMPGMNGIELLIQVRQEFGDIPFILFTGRGREEVVIQAINNGADFYTQKGGDPQSQFAELKQQVIQAVTRKKAEQSLVNAIEDLQAANARYEALISASRTGAWEYNGNSGKYWFSAEYLSMLGYNPDESNSDTMQDFNQVWIDLLHPDDREPAIHTWTSYLNHPEGMYENVFRMQKHDGTWIWILSRGKTLLDKEGNFSNITTGTHIDITEQKETEEQLLKRNEELFAAYEEISATEEELRNNYEEIEASKKSLEISEKRYSRTLESINDGLWDLNLNSNELFVSPHFYRMCGYEPYSYPADMATIISHVHPEDQEALNEAFSKGIESGETFLVECRFLQQNNEYLWVLVRGRVIESDSNGAPIRISGTLSDISIRKEIEITLDENRRTLQTLINNLNGMVYRCKNDPDWTMEVVSEGVISLTGYSPEDLIGNLNISYGNIIHPEDRKTVEEFVENGISQNEPFKLSYRVVTKDGQIKWVWEQGRGIFKEDKLLFIEGYITDITSEVKAENALRKMGHSIEHLNEGVFWFNNEGIIFDANIAFIQLLSNSKEKILQSHIENLPFILQSTTWSEFIKQAEKKGSAIADSLLMISPDNQKYIRISISYGDFNNEILFCGITNDHTQEEEYLKEVLQKKEELASAYEELLSTEEDLKRQYLHLKEIKEALQKSEHQYRSIFNDAILGIYQLTPDGEYLKVNPAFANMLGYTSPEEMKNSDLTFFKQIISSHEQLEKFKSLIMIESDIRGLELEMLRKDKTPIWISTNIHITRNEYGNIALIEGSLENITLRKKAEAENEIALAQIRKNLAELSILNDGLRNPLTIIATASDSCENVTSKMINEQVNRIDKLVNELDKRWMESDKIIQYLQKYHNY